MAHKVLFPLPDRDFDVTEVAVPWRLLRDAGCEVVFATEEGRAPAADPLLLTGVVFGQLGAEPEPKAFYEALEADAAFMSPIAWSGLGDLRGFDGLFLAGGHAQGMKQYLGSEGLQALIADYWGTGRPVGAICHGVLVLARTIDPETGLSVLHGRKTTCLPKYMERSAYWLTAWKLGRYYRTYPAYVEEEVRVAVGEPSNFHRGPRTLIRRGTAEDDGPAFVVRDENYVSGRWPGDAYLIAKAFLELLDQSPAGK